MDSSIKKTLVNRNGNITIEKTQRTDAEHRVYKINNALELERLDTVAATIKSLYGGDISFIILSSQDEGLMGFTDLVGINLPCIKYTKEFIASGSRNESAYHKKFPWVRPYTNEYIAYHENISKHLLDMTKSGDNTIYSIRELKQTANESAKRYLAL